MKLAVVAPAVTTTVAGTVAAAVLLLDSVTVRCELVPTAGAFSVTVAVELTFPPGTLVGFSVTEATTGNFTTSEKGWTKLDPTPLLAVNVMLYVPFVPAAGVPLNAPVPAVNVTPLGSAPDSAIVGAGKPAAVVVKDPANPTVKLALAALVIAGG